MANGSVQRGTNTAISVVLPHPKITDIQKAQNLDSPGPPDEIGGRLFATGSWTVICKSEEGLYVARHPRTSTLRLNYWARALVPFLWRHIIKMYTKYIDEILNLLSSIHTCNSLLASHLYWRLRTEDLESQPALYIVYRDLLRNDGTPCYWESCQTTTGA